MLQIKVKSSPLDLDKNTRVQLVLRSPLFFDDDGSASYNFTFPDTDKNRKILGLHSKITMINFPVEIKNVSIVFDGVELKSGIMLIERTINGLMECCLGVDKGEFNYLSQKKLLTELNFSPISYNRTKQGSQGSILNVTNQTYPGAKFAYFPVYNPGLFRDTFFDEFFNLTMKRFRLMLSQAASTFHVLMHNPPYGYFFRLQQDGFITPYTDVDGTPKTAYDDFERRIVEYESISDRYSNWIMDHPNYIYHFYLYFFSWINQFNLWPQLVGAYRLCNEFWSAGWVNYVDIKFLDHEQRPGRHIVPFPYLCSVIDQAISDIGYVKGKNFFKDSRELSSLCLVTMNLADTNYGMIQGESHNFEIRLNEHLPDVAISDLLSNICRLFNCSLFVNADRSIDIEHNTSILKDTKTLDWSENCRLTETITTPARRFKFHYNVSEDDYFSQKVKQEGVLKFKRLDDVWSASDLPDAWTQVAEINVVCYVTSVQAFYITAFEDDNLVWKYYTKMDADFIAEGQNQETQNIDPNIGYLTKQPYGWYAGSDSNIFLQQGYDFPYFEFARCDIKGNALLHAISFDAEYNSSQIKLMFNRGRQHFTPHPMCNFDTMPYGSPDDRYLGQMLPGSNYSLMWEGENGIYNRFWKDWVYFLNNIARDARALKQLTAIQIKQFDFRQKPIIDGVKYLCKEIRVDVSINMISPAEIDLVRC